MKYKFDLKVRRVEEKRLENREKLGELLTSLRKRKGKKWQDSFIEADRNIYFGGSIEIDKDKCIACGACAEICPTGAIEVDDKDGVRYIYHKMQICVGCRKCEKSCDDDAIKANPGLNLKTFFEGSLELKKEAELILCVQCKRPVGPKAAIEKLKKILEEESHIHSELDFCQKCRKWRTAYEAVPRLSILIGRTASEISGKKESGE
ncbi:MAG: 4Fe-4S dicluster domain-containing protein [Candidatus Schekmanbacteria bacterium]|nr:MAG: 4Fe-4S dicluster domain-containing protein [Candidatus Schekmanbacteria bacterium]